METTSTEKEIAEHAANDLSVDFVCSFEEPGRLFDKRFRIDIVAIPKDPSIPFIVGIECKNGRTKIGRWGAQCIDYSYAEFDIAKDIGKPMLVSLWRPDIHGQTPYEESAPKWRYLDRVLGQLGVGIWWVRNIDKPHKELRLCIGSSPIYTQDTNGHGVWRPMATNFNCNKHGSR